MSRAILSRHKDGKPRLTASLSRDFLSLDRKEGYGLYDAGMLLPLEEARNLRDFLNAEVPE